MAARTGSEKSSRPGAPRYHVAEDLPAPEGTVVVAPEAGELLRLRDRFYLGTGVVMLATDTGITIALGEVAPGSWQEFGLAEGDRVAAGEPIARVGRLDMLHFEAYAGRKARTERWWVGDPPPPDLLDPTRYLERARDGECKPVVEAPPVEPAPAPVPQPPEDPEPVMPKYDVPPVPWKIKPPRPVVQPPLWVLPVFALLLAGES